MLAVIRTQSQDTTHNWRRRRDMTASARFGKVDEFDPHRDEWPQYVERLGYYFVANSAEAGKKKAILLTSIEPPRTRYCGPLLRPTGLEEKSYDKLVKLLEDHFNPKPSETVERFKFNTRFRKPGESVAVFITQLRSLSERCNYGASLEAMLRDLLVGGINDDTI